MRKATLVLLFLASCSLALAGTNGAMLMGSGSVQVNGSPAAKSFTVFPGDRIQTSTDGSAVIKSADAVVSIASDSAIQYQGNSLIFERGNVLVTAPRGMSAHFGNLAISSNPTQSVKFQLTSANGVDRIAAIDGSLSITDGAHSAKLEPGYMMVRAPVTASDDRNSPTGTAGIPGWVTVLIILGILGGIFGGLWAAGAFNSPPSPHVP
jgi:hypothetical protein